MKCLMIHISKNYKNDEKWHEKELKFCNIYIFLANDENTKNDFKEVYLLDNYKILEKIIPKCLFIFKAEVIQKSEQSE